MLKICKIESSQKQHGLVAPKPTSICYQLYSQCLLCNNQCMYVYSIKQAKKMNELENNESKHIVVGVIC